MSEDLQCPFPDTRHPMLERTDFESCQQRIRLTIIGKYNGKNIYESPLMKDHFPYGSCPHRCYCWRNLRLHQQGPVRAKSLTTFHLKKRKGSSPTENLIESLSNSLPHQLKHTNTSSSNNNQLTERHLKQEQKLRGQNRGGILIPGYRTSAHSTRMVQGHKPTSRIQHTSRTNATNATQENGEVLYEEHSMFLAG
ncbi:hypothetical protein Tco_1051431 [Tanacetum coccineum]